MPRRPTEPYWRERIRAITENDRLGPGPIRRQFEEEAQKGGRKDWPSERTIGRIQSEFRQLSEEDRRPYRELYWPESFERGDLPWEASAAAIELLQVWEKASRNAPTMETKGEVEVIWSGRRPSTRLARWFWRVTQAAPQLKPKMRLYFAAWLGQTRGTRHAQHSWRALEAYLQYSPWRSEEAKTALIAARAEGKAPRFPTFFVVIKGFLDAGYEWESPSGHESVVLVELPDSILLDDSLEEDDS